MMKEKKAYSAIWITWENQLRNRSLSNAVGAQLYELSSPYSRWLKYPSLLIRTSQILLSSRNRTVIVQNPSLLLALYANIFCRLLGKRVIVDSHNGGLFPFEGKYFFLNCLAKLVLYSSQYTIVTNKVLARYVRIFNGKVVVVPDPLPDFQPSLKSESVNSRKNIVFICTWASDEPYEEVIKAAQLLPENIHIHITGRYEKHYRNLKNNLPKNTTLMGYLSNDDYLKLLNSADVIIDLTTRKHCLVCGAYESTALEKPMILSDTSALRDYFFQGALFTDNTAKDLASKIIYSLETHDELVQKVHDLKLIIHKTWQEKLDNLKSIISN